MSTAAEFDQLSAVASSQYRNACGREDLERASRTPNTEVESEFVLLLRVRPDQPIASMFFVTTSSVLASSAVGLNSMTSVPAKISGK